MRKRWILVVAVAVLILLAAAAAVLFLLTRRGLPRTSGVLQTDVGNEVEVYRDGYGIPHIIGRSAADICYAQGYVQAQDRLWQMDMSRRGVSGKLSEILGEGFIDTDRFTLTIGFYRAAAATYEQLGPEAREALEAYARGVNAYIEDNRGKLSIEFLLLGYEPEPWEPVDSVAISKYMAWYLGGNMNTELFLSAAMEKVGEELALELFPTYPETGPVIVPTIESEAAFTPDDITGLVKLSRLADLNNVSAFVPGLGSNNWVVSGTKTETGSALLANDMHLGLGVPSIWYVNHLILENEYNATGVIFPGIPGIIVGFTEHIAWGVTNTGPDVQDLYLIELNPANPHQYKYMEEWVDAEVVIEEIKVKGETEPRPLEVVITRYGPVISGVVGLEQPLSLRWTALEATREMEAVLGFLRATDWDEFCTALEGFMSPTQNFVFADRAGNIGYRANGHIPIRRGGNGLLPVDGSTDEFEWEGYIPWDELPQLYNPPEGIIVTANHRVVDDDYPYLVSVEWSAPYRALGIWRELEGKDRLGMEDMLRAQRSYYNTQAELLAPVLLEALETADLDSLQQDALNIFSAWSRDPVETADQAGPALFNTLYLKMLARTFADELGEELYERFLRSRGGHNTLDRILLDGESAWFNDVNTNDTETRDDIVVAAFQDTAAELRERLGDDPGKWRWGDLHTVTFRHEMGSVKMLERFFNRGPFPIGGSGQTPANMSYPPAIPFRVSVSAPWRYMVDLHDLSGLDALAVGNSGHPFSKHYDDQMEMWLAGEYKEMIFDPAAVRALTEKLILTPR